MKEMREEKGDEREIGEGKRDEREMGEGEIHIEREREMGEGKRDGREGKRDGRKRLDRGGGLHVLQGVLGNHGRPVSLFRHHFHHHQRDRQDLGGLGLQTNRHFQLIQGVLDDPIMVSHVTIHSLHHPICSVHSDQSLQEIQRAHVHQLPHVLQ